MKVGLKALVAVVMVTGLSSCGPRFDDVEVVREFAPPTLAKHPIHLEKQDEHCLGTFNVDDEIVLGINQFISNQKVTNYVYFNNQIVNNNISSKSKGPISETKYGESTLAEANLIYIPKLGEYAPDGFFFPKRIKQKQDLTVCPGSTSYKTKAYENAGLNISNNISKTYQALLKADPSLELRPIKVNVAPLHKKLFKFNYGPNDLQQVELYETDNAYYNRLTEEITFLPQSKEFQIKNGELFYFEIPMVASHEYGHHVFSTLVTSKISAMESEAKPDLATSKTCFESSINHNHQELQVTSKTRNNSAKFALGAINEGFSDLIARYSLGRKENGLEGVGCFENNREVEVGNYVAHGREIKKVFSHENLEILNSEFVVKEDTNCNTPNFQAIHDVGAVFAHSMHKTISKIITDDQTRLKVLLAWAKEISKNYQAEKDMLAGEYLFRAIERFYQLALDEKDLELTAENCNELNHVFIGNHDYKCKYLVKVIEHKKSPDKSELPKI